MRNIKPGNVYYTRFNPNNIILVIAVDMYGVKMIDARGSYCELDMHLFVKHVRNKDWLLRHD